MSVSLYNQKVRTVKYLALVYDEILKSHPHLKLSTWNEFSAEPKFRMLIGTHAKEPDMSLCRFISETGISQEDLVAAIGRASQTFMFTDTMISPLTVIDVNATSRLVTVRVGEISVVVPGDVWTHLIQMKMSESQLYDCMLRYCDMGTNTRYFSIVGGDIYKYLETQSSVPTVECFASPFDNTLATYCSPFVEDLESSGNFFPFINKVHEQNKVLLLLMNPPDIDEVINSAVSVAYNYVNLHVGSGFILFLTRVHPSLDEAGIASIVTMGYAIYSHGVVPDLSFLKPSSEELYMAGVPGIKLLLANTDDTVSRWVFNIIKSKTKLNINQMKKIQLDLRKRDATDQDYYDAYKAAMKPNSSSISSGWNNVEDIAGRAKRRVQDLAVYLEALAPHAGAYLDYGCADGSITHAIGTAVGAKEIIGMDVKNTLDPQYGVIYIESFSQIPDNYVKLATAMMTLHHVRDITDIIRNIYRVLVPGGVFILREHGFTTPESVGAVMIEHIMYDYVSGSSTYEEALKTNQLYPRTKEEINREMMTAGFAEMETLDMPSNDFAYYGVYRKPGETCPT